MIRYRYRMRPYAADGALNGSRIRDQGAKILKTHLFSYWYATQVRLSCRLAPWLAGLPVFDTHMTAHRLPTESVGAKCDPGIIP